MKSYLVKEWMTESPLFVTSETNLTEADVMMEARRIRHLPIVDDGKLVGILSLGDLREAKTQMASGAEPQVKDLMTADPITIPEVTTMALAAQTMLQARISALPLTDDFGELSGILSESDILRLFIEESKAG